MVAVRAQISLYFKIIVTSFSLDWCDRVTINTYIAGTTPPKEGALHAKRVHIYRLFPCNPWEIRTTGYLLQPNRRNPSSTTGYNHPW